MRPLNARERRFAAVGILVAGIAVSWLTVVEPVIGGFIARAAEREELLDRYTRGERLLAGIPSWRARAAEQARTARQYAIPAPTEVLAAEALKARVRQMAGPQAIKAVQEVNAGVSPGWVRVRADMELTLDQLVVGLKRLESGVPYVVVEYLSVGADRAFRTGQLSEMAVRLEVSAPFRASGGR